MIKINLVREGRAVRGAGVVSAPTSAAGPTDKNNLILGVLVVLGVLFAGGWWYLDYRTLTEKQDTVLQKQNEAQSLDKIIKEVDDFKRQQESLQKRIDLINQLKQNQKGPVRLMDRVSQDLPDLVWIDKMSVAGGVVTIDGRGLNPNAIANFVENIKNDPMFEEPDLGNLVQISAAPLVYGYTMKFHFSYVPKTDTAAGAAAPGTATGTTGTSGTAGTLPPSTPARR